MAALDFPNSPTMNQVFPAPNGANYSWDGECWTAAGSGAFLWRKNATDPTLIEPVPPMTRSSASLDPTSPMHLATKQYVDGKAPVTWLAIDPPPVPVNGQLWWRNDPDGVLYIYYNDGNSSQWVPASPSSAPQWGVSGNYLTPLDALKGIMVTGPVPGQIALTFGMSANKHRLRDVGTSGVQLLTNSAGTATPDDATKPSWFLQLNPANDVFDVYRAPAAASQTFGLVMRVSLTEVLAPSNLTVGGNANVGSAGAPAINLGQRCKFESWDGGICNWYCNDSTTVNYNAGLPGWKITADYRAPGVLSISYHAAGAGYTTSVNLDAACNIIITGSVGQKSSGTTWANPSDVRIKKNIKDYDAGLEQVLKLRPVRFEHNGFADTVDGTICYGYMADEVRSILPECVSKTTRTVDEEEIELDLLDTSNISLAVVNAIKELAARVIALEGK